MKFNSFQKSKLDHFVSMQHNALCLIPPTGSYSDEQKEKAFHLKKTNKPSKYWLRANPDIHHLFTCQSNSSP